MNYEIFCLGEDVLNDKWSLRILIDPENGTAELDPQHESQNGTYMSIYHNRQFTVDAPATLLVEEFEAWKDDNQDFLDELKENFQTDFNGSNKFGVYTSRGEEIKEFLQQDEPSARIEKWDVSEASSESISELVKNFDVNRKSIEEKAKEIIEFQIGKGYLALNVEEALESYFDDHPSFYKMVDAWSDTLDEYPETNSPEGLQAYISGAYRYAFVTEEIARKLYEAWKETREYVEQTGNVTLGMSELQNKCEEIEDSVYA